MNDLDRPLKVIGNGRIFTSTPNDSDKSFYEEKTEEVHQEAMYWIGPYDLPEDLEDDLGQRLQPIAERCWGSIESSLSNVWNEVVVGNDNGHLPDSKRMMLRKKNRKINKLARRSRRVN